MHTFWFIVLLIGGVCGIKSGVHNLIEEHRDGTIWFVLAAVNFILAGVELTKIS